MAALITLVNESSNCLSSTLNDKIGSLVIEERGYNNNYNNNNNNGYPPDANQRVIIYVDENYRGQSTSSRRHLQRYVTDRFPW